MRFDIDSGIGASRFLHQSSQQDLASIIKNYSDERFSSKISKAIKAKENLKTTFEHLKFKCKCGMVPNAKIIVI